MNGAFSKRCGCRDENGKQLGKTCPRLGQKGHGAWSFVVDVRSANGKRKQLKRGGFVTRKAAEAACEAVVGNVRTGHSTDDRLTVGEWLDHWLAEKSTQSGISSSGRTIRASTEAIYSQHIRDYLKPQLGHLALSSLSADDISAAYRRILATAAQQTEQRRVQRPDGPVRTLGPATLRRIHACLSAALNRAVKARRIAYNPCAGVDLPDEQRPQVHPWEPAELGAFLDHVQGHRLGVLFEVIAACGLRRGEALGLRWSDVDLERGTLTIRQQLLSRWDAAGPVFGPPKTKAGEHRVIEVDSQTLGGLIGHRLAQDTERQLWGTGYEDRGLVFAQENGRPYDPSRITKEFGALAKAAGLRPVRLHDLRHGAASLMLAAGIPVEVVSKRLGHSSIGITMDTYSHLLEGVGRRAAEAAMGLVPRAPRTLRDHDVTITGQDIKQGTSPDAGKVPLTRENR